MQSLWRRQSLLNGTEDQSLGQFYLSRDGWAGLDFGSFAKGEFFYALEFGYT
jgi:hypothetical protein